MITKAMNFLVMVSVLALAGCGTPITIPEDSEQDIGEIRSRGERELDPQVPEDTLDTLVSGNKAFAFRLFQQLRSSDGNLFYSPYSISIALAMTYAGARGETEAEMAQALSFLLPQAELHPAFNRLDQELGRRQGDGAGEEGEGFKLNVANALWGERTYEFRDDYLDLLARNYGAGLRLMDFIQASEESRLTINDWISDETEGKIEDLIPPGAIDHLTRLVLTNAIYFNAAWQTPFQESETRQAPFHLLDGGTVDVAMMQQQAAMSVFEGEGFRVVDIPYQGGQLSMLIILPESEKYEAVEGSLDAATLDDLVENLVPAQVVLRMPKFSFESSFGLNGPLAEMGMREAFGPTADFSGMDGGGEIFISSIIHKAFVAVDETGTEAAAATAVIMSVTSVVETVEITLDRPFIFLIRDRMTGTTLFMGRVLNPLS